MTATGLINLSPCITPTQQVLLQLGTPILEEAVVARHKKHAKLGMLWSDVRWLAFGIAALVAFESFGGLWQRTLVVGTAGILLGGLFSWLVSMELFWLTSNYADFRTSNPVPAHVVALVGTLEAAGVASSQIKVEHLKNDPILFVIEPNSSSRYDLVIW